MLDNYGVKDIKTLEGIEAIRLRAGMYIGSTGPAGVKHITLEIISNAIDEYLNGHCNSCDIVVDNDNYITITDNGRGVPFGQADDGTETLENIFTKLHTGAKFDSSGKTGYNTSGGMNGVGAKATNALSEIFQVYSRRDGKVAHMTFKKGIRTNYQIIKGEEGQQGTTISFKPDIEIFKEGIELDYTALRRQIQELAYLSPGLVFTLKYKEKEQETIVSQNGIKDYLNDLSKDNLTSMFYTETMEDRIGVKVAMAYNNSYSDTYKLFTNSIPNSGGTHLTGFRTALTQTINEYAREKKLLKEKDSNITGDELKEGLVLVLSFVMPDPVFSGQTKDVLSSSEARTMVQRLVSKEIRIWLDANSKDAKTIIEKALLARIAREKAKLAKDAVRENKERKKRRVINPDKLKDAETLGENSILLCVEGNSASASMAVARDTAKYGILGLRGKPLNLLTNSQEKANKNEEIQLLISALGITPGKYDAKDLRYGKLAIASDADSDGLHIGLLVASAIYALCPEFIKEGRLCWLRSPLYILKNGKTESYYYSDEELAAAGGTALKGELQRNKGLGAMSAEQAKNSMFNDKYQRLDILEYSDEAINKLKDLMGESIGPRKNFIFNKIDFSEIKE